MKVFLNILLTLIVLGAFLSACWLGVRTGNHWAVVFIFFIVALYFFLTRSFQYSSSMHVIQLFSANTLIGLVIMGIGVMAVWLGISELSVPVHFSRTLSNLIANSIRNTIGSIGVSLLMWWFGVVLIFIAIGRLRVSKPTSPNPSIKLDA